MNVQKVERKECVTFLQSRREERQCQENTVEKMIFLKQVLKDQELFTRHLMMEKQDIRKHEDKKRKRYALISSTSKSIDYTAPGQLAEGEIESYILLKK